MADWTIKQNDDAPAISALLSYSDDSIPDLTGASVVCKWRPTSGGAKKEGAATIDDLPTARVTRSWNTGGNTDDTATAGDFNVEWEVTFSNNKKTTFPAEGYMSLKITDDLD